MWHAVNQRGGLVAALAILAAVTFGSIAITPGPAPSLERIWLASALVAAGTLAIAATLARGSRRRRDAVVAAVLAGIALASPMLPGGPAAWVTSARCMIWLMPWLALVNGLSTRADCVAHPATGS